MYLHQISFIRLGIMILVITATTFFGGVRPASATIFFDWVCTNKNMSGQCLDDNGIIDSGLEFTIGFKDSAVFGAATISGGDDVGLESISFTSGVGDGFTVLLEHMVVDRANLFLQFNASADEIIRLEDSGTDTLLWFGLGAINPSGWVRFRESHGGGAYAINGRWDRQGATANNSTEIAGKFVRRSGSVVPEPFTLILLDLGLLGLSVKKPMSI